jgi:hypothetical protein
MPVHRPAFEIPTVRRRITPHAKPQHTACSHHSRGAGRRIVKRDVQALLDGLTKRDTSVTNKSGMTPVPEPDEPTWEVLRPNSGRNAMRRFDGRTRSILTVAAVIAIVVNAGVAWAYWRITESEPKPAEAGTAVEMTLRGRSDYNQPLEPGGRGDLTVTLTNGHDFPVRITSVREAIGGVVADDEHRDNGCKAPIVTLSQESFTVKWDVERNDIGAFTIEDGLTMAPAAHSACLGATYTIPLQVGGFSQGK